MLLYINGLTLFLLILILYLEPVAHFFAVIPLSIHEIGICLSVSAISVLWIEIWKAIKRNQTSQKGILENK
jgi:Ca2+-transporting ATPase